MANKHGKAKQGTTFANLPIKAEYTTFDTKSVRMWLQSNQRFLEDLSAKRPDLASEAGRQAGNCKAWYDWTLSAKASDLNRQFQTWRDHVKANGELWTQKLA